MSYELFISYSRKDNAPQKSGDSKGWVSALWDEILADHRRFSTEPLRIFFATEEIKSMDDWRHRILEALRQSRILLVCLSPNYFHSEYCRMEWEEYLKRQVHSLMGHDSIAPVYFIEVPGSDEQGNAAAFAQWVAQIQPWLEGVMRPNFTDLRPFFPDGLSALQCEEVHRRMETLGTSLWERIQRARRATGVPGNLRRLNPHFIGRDKELRQLHENIALGAVGVVTAINGLGGQGKTELAIAYAHGWADSYPAGLWILGAEGKKEILPLLGDLCAELGIPLSAGANETADQRGRRVLAELKRRAVETTPRDPAKGAACLVILDNVSEPDLLAEPQLAQLTHEDWLRVVVTTRLGEDVLPASRRKSLALIAVDALGLDDAGRLIEDHTPDARWPAATTAVDAAAAREIARELGGFTLAVESVAIYLGLHPEIRPADYLARLRAEGLPSVDNLPTHANVAAQMQHREKQLRLVLDPTLTGLTPPERTALDYAALLPPDSIPWPWLRELVSQEHPDAPTTRDGYPAPWTALRRRLEGLRLLTPGDHPEVSRIHRLVAAHIVKCFTDSGVAQKPDLNTAVSKSVADENELTSDSPQALGSQRCAQMIRRLRKMVEERALELQDTWEHEPATLWQLVPLQETVQHWPHSERDAPLARIAGIVGTIEQEIGCLDAAEPFLVLANDVMSLIYAANPQSGEAARNRSVASGKLGDFFLQRGQPGDATSALRCLQQALGIEKKLWADDPQSTKLGQDVAVSLNKLGDFYRRLGTPGDAAGALRCFQEAHNVAKKLWADDPQSGPVARLVMVSLSKLGESYLQRGQAGDSAEAVLSFQKFHDVAQKLWAENPRSAQAAQDLAMSLDPLGKFYLERGQPGDFEEALICFKRMHEMAQLLWSESPQSAYAARYMAMSLDRLRVFYLLRALAGDMAEALRCAHQCHDMSQQLLGINPKSAEAGRNVFMSLLQLGDCYLQRGQPGDTDKVLNYLRQSFEVAQKLRSANPQSAEAARDVATVLSKLAQFHTQRGQPGDGAEALRYIRDFNDSARKLCMENSQSAEAARDLSVSLEMLGAFFFERGQPGDAPQALRCFQESLEVRQKRWADNPHSAKAAREVGLGLGRLGDFYRLRGEPGDAEQSLSCFQQYLDIARKIHADNSQSAETARDLMVALERQGVFCMQRGRPGDMEQALRSFQEALEMARSLLAENPRSSPKTKDVAVILQRLGDFYGQRGQPGDSDEALLCFQQNYDITRKLRDDNPKAPDAADSVTISSGKLGDFYLRRGQHRDRQEALRYFQESLDTARKVWMDHPQSRRAARSCMIALSHMGTLHLRLGQGDKALDYAKEAHKGTRDLYEANPQSAESGHDLSVSLEELGACYVRRGNPGDAAEALACFQQALETREKLWEANPESVARARDVVCMHQRLAEYFEEAGGQEVAMAHRSENYRILHELHSAGCCLDAAILRYYDQLHAMFGEESSRSDGAVSPLGMLFNEAGPTDASSPGSFAVEHGEPPPTKVGAANVEQAVAEGRALLRAGRMEDALAHYRSLLFPNDGIRMSPQAPVEAKVDFIAALMLVQNVDGAECHLADLGDTDHPRLASLRKLLCDWRTSLTWAQKVGIKKKPPLLPPKIPPE
jgi:tetratricopeptide (TPR) repeat protein